jgi:similar to stage IV sporulation protein
MLNLKSYIEFTVFGAYSSEFIDYLVASDFSLSEITSTHEIYTIRTSVASYRAIARKAREFRVKTKVVRRVGVYFILRRYRKRVGILVGLLMFFAIIVMMSNFVWSVRITGLCEGSELSRWQILEKLDENGISPGVYIHSFNANAAEIELTLAIEELAWVSIERTGSRVNVKVSERLDEDSEGIPLSQPCNVIASRSGVLVRAEVYRGELLYEVGSGINEGDVIVSGAILDEGIAGRVSYVHADALLLIEITESVEFFQPFTVLHRAKNGHSRSNQSVVFLGHRFGGEVDINPHSDHVTYSETMTAPTFFGFPLPFRILNQSYVFYDRVQVTDPPVTALEKLNRDIELYEANFLDGAEIISREAEYFPEEDGIHAVVRYVYQVNAAVKQEIFLS